MPSTSPKLNVSDLIPFSNAVAGHQGVCSDESGALVVKPCTQAEIDFYQSTSSGHAAFQKFIPTFMGTLTAGGLGSENADGSAAIAVAGEEAQIGTAQGRKLDTDVSIVLENVTAGFKKPNVIDLKLGSQLWDQDATEEKKQRMDDVSRTTTSGSLGFRIAGMRIYRPSGRPEDIGKFSENIDSTEEDYLSADKMYGRRFDAENVQEAFIEFFGPDRRSLQTNAATRGILTHLTKEIAALESVLEKEESRFYSSSILIVYEGDQEALNTALEGETQRREALSNAPTTANTTEDSDDDDEEAQFPKTCELRMIDFAHSQWTPGNGPDENVLQGIRNVRKIVAKLASES